jgi:hypothetical protein
VAVTRHILACGSQYFWCSDEHANGWAILLFLAAAAVVVGVLLIAALISAHSRD